MAVMELSLAENIIKGILALSTFITVALYHIIWKYLSKKPLGMQTCYDQAVKDLLIITFLASLTSNITTLGWGPFSVFPNMVVVYMSVQIFFGTLAFTQIMMTVLVRYAYIFHSTRINAVDDNLLLTILRKINFFASAASTTFECLSHDFRLGKTYQYLTKIPNDNIQSFPFSTVKLIIIVDILAVIIMQAKIEWGKYGTTNSEVIEESFWKLRTIVSLTSLGSILCVLWLMDIFLEESYDYSRLKFTTTMNILLCNVCPLLLILRNEQISDFAVSYLNVNHIFFQEPNQ